MADWTRGMTRTYEFWRVNPDTWGDVERLDTVTGAVIRRDSDIDTLGGATFEMDAWEGEMYVRTYLVTIQDGVRERWPLGTHLLISDGEDYDGMRGSISVEAYTPLKELADDMPPLGYTVSSGLYGDRAASLVSLHSRIPVIGEGGGSQVQEPYTSDPDSDSWLSFISGLLAKDGLEIGLTPRGEVLLRPVQDARSLAPVHTFSDDARSIMQPAVSVVGNAEEVPNTVEVVYSGGDTVLSCVLVDNGDSPTSVKSRGRVVRHRESNPELPDSPTQSDVNEAARRLMRELTHRTYDVTFTHAFVPDVLPGNAVRIAYRGMGLDALGVVVSQEIECTPACQVVTTARFTKE